MQNTTEKHCGCAGEGFRCEECSQHGHISGPRCNQFQDWTVDNVQRTAADVGKNYDTTQPVKTVKCDRRGNRSRSHPRKWYVISETVARIDTVKQDKKDPDIAYVHTTEGKNSAGPHVSSPHPEKETTTRTAIIGPDTALSKAHLMALLTTLSATMTSQATTLASQAKVLGSHTTAIATLAAQTTKSRSGNSDRDGNGNHEIKATIATATATMATMPAVTKQATTLMITLRMARYIRMHFIVLKTC